MWNRRQQTDKAMAEHPSNQTATRDVQWERPILVGSCPSSGSTLLSVLLDAHPDILCGPELAIFSHPIFWREDGNAWREGVRRLVASELHQRKGPGWTLAGGYAPYVSIDWRNFPWYLTDRDRVISLVEESPDRDSFLRAFFEPSLRARDKLIWAEKSPPNIFAIPHFLKAVDHARAVVVVRDGRDVICSLMARGISFSEAAAIWTLEACMSLALGQHPRVILLRYEDLVREPRETLTSLTRKLGVRQEVDAMLAYRRRSLRMQDDRTLRNTSTWKQSPTEPINASSIDRWKKELSSVQLGLLYCQRVQKVIFHAEHFPGLRDMVGMAPADILEALGYSVGPSPQLTDGIWPYLWEENGLLENTRQPQRYACRYVRPILDDVQWDMTPEKLFKMLVTFHEAKSEAIGLKRYIESQQKRTEKLKLRAHELELQFQEARARLGRRLGIKGALCELLGLNACREAACKLRKRRASPSAPRRRVP